MAKDVGNIMLPEEDQEQLVAYLDGELDATEVQQVERRLSEDQAYRRLLADLERSWQLLDELPQPTAGEDFTRTTVEMVALDISGQLKTQRPRWRRSIWMQRAAFAAATVASAWAGFILVQYALDSPNRRLLRDLPLIERVDAYRHVDDLSLLVDLRERGIFETEPSAQNTTESNGSDINTTD